MATMHPLISTTELAHRLDEVVLNDIRWALTDPDHGRQDYQAGHIPGAVFVDLDTDLSSEPGPGRHPLPDPGVFAQTLGRLGIGPSDEVVVYDDMNNTIAARLWWMLKSIGHDRVRVLDGGYQRWVEEGRLVERGDTTRDRTTHPQGDFAGVATRHDLAGRPHVDARPADRYRGEVEPVDPKAGHIPGAINLPATGNTGDDGRFLAADDLLQRFDQVGDGAVVSCGSGVTACHNALAMVVAGRKMPHVYVGSFSEWSNLDLPVNVGDDP